MEVFNNRHDARRRAIAFRHGSLKDGIHYTVGAERRREEENTETWRRQTGKKKCHLAGRLEGPPAACI